MKQHISRKNIYLVFLIINIITTLIRYQFVPDQSLSFHLTTFLLAFIFYALGWEILIRIHAYFEHILPIASKPLLRMLVQILLVSIVFFIFSQLLYRYTAYFFHFSMPEKDVFGEAIFSGFMYAVIFNFLLFGSYYFQLWKSDLVVRMRLEKEQAVVKYDALRNQLNPHFLFNALTSLNGLIFENQQLASDFLQQLSKVYRYILQNKENSTVSLEAELKFVEHYISLLKMRFEDAIVIDIDVTEMDEDKGVVPVILQTLIENAVKHNVVSIKSPLMVQIWTENEYLIVRNNKTKKEQVETSNKQGLTNLRALYGFLSDKPIEIEDCAETYEIRIPLID